MVKATLRPPYPRGRRPDTNCTGGWVSPRTGLNGCKKNPGFYTGKVQPAASRFINKQTLQQTSRNILLLEKLTVAQLVNKILTFYGTKTFVVIFIVVPCMLFQSLLCCSNSCTSLHFKILKSDTKTLKIRLYMFRSPLKLSSATYRHSL